MNWIKTSERLPDINDNSGWSENVLALCDGDIRILYFSYQYEKWYDERSFGSDALNVEYWMPLPPKTRID